MHLLSLPIEILQYIILFLDAESIKNLSKNKMIFYRVLNDICLRQLARLYLSHDEIKNPSKLILDQILYIERITLLQQYPPMNMKQLCKLFNIDRDYIDEAFMESIYTHGGLNILSHPMNLEDITLLEDYYFTNDWKKYLIEGINLCMTKGYHHGLHRILKVIDPDTTIAVGPFIVGVAWVPPWTEEEQELPGKIEFITYSEIK